MFNNLINPQSEEWRAGDLCKDETDDLSFRQGVISYNNGQYSQAERHFKDSISQNALSLPGNFNLGRTLMKDPERFVEAKNIFYKCIIFEPKRWESYLNLSCIQYCLRNYQKSASILQKVIQINPMMEQRGSYIIGLIYSNHIKNFEKAEHYLWRAFMLNDNKYQYFRNLHDMYQKLGRYGDSFSFLSRYYEQRPDCPYVLYELGKCFQSRKDYDMSERFYRRTIQSNKNFVKAYNRLGEVYLAIGNYAYAKSHFEKALRLDQNMTEARTNLRNLCNLCNLELKSTSQPRAITDQTIREDQMNIRMKEQQRSSRGEKNNAESIFKKFMLLQTEKSRSANRMNLANSI